MSTDTLGKESSTESILLREKLDKVEILTLNKSKSRNSLSLSMIESLKKALDSIASDKTIGAVVLASTGPAFCAGHDLKELTARRSDDDGGRAFFEQTMDACSEMMQTIVGMPQPVIAAVQGVATAAGCQLVASCDLAIASSESQFATPGVGIGLFCSTPMVALSRNVSRKQAMEMLLTGDMISAEEAMRIGLVNKIVHEQEEKQEAIQLARRICSNSLHAVRVGKKAFYEQVELNLKDAYEHTSKIMVENLLADEAEEGICAFVEKRKPKWN